MIFYTVIYVAVSLYQEMEVASSGKAPYLLILAGNGRTNLAKYLSRAKPQSCADGIMCSIVDGFDNERSPWC